MWTANTLSAPLLSGEALHIPDGFLSVPVALVAWLLTVGFVAAALRVTRGTLGERQVPLMGVLAAFIFAAQAFNFPVAGGTSGHMLGGALAAILLGPWPALLVMTAVIALQGLLFQDGGLLAMGANIFIMGVLTVWVGYFTYQALVRVNRTLAAFAAGWLSVMAAAVLTSFLLALSGTSALGIVLPAMAGVHALIGIGEGLITGAAVALVQRALPGLFAEHAAGERIAAGTWAAGGLVASVVVGVLAVFFASGSPDGLERVAEDKGFLEAAQEPLFQVIPDYVFPGIGNEALAGVVAMVLGTLLLFVVGYGLARLVRRRRALT